MSDLQARGGAWLCYCLLGALILPASSFGQSGKKPGWLSDRPEASGYYVGVGIASRQNVASEDAQKTATAAAIDQIAQQIEIHVESSSRLDVQEVDLAARTTYRNEVKTKVDVSNLENVEIVDTWIGEDDIWVYARLSKGAYREAVQKKEAAVKARALDLYKESQRYGAWEVVPRLERLLEGIGLLYAAGLGDYRIDLDGKARALDSLIVAGIRREAKKISLQPVKPVFQVQPGANANRRIEAKASALVGDQARPLARLPVRVDLERDDDGRLVPSALADDQGVIAIEMTEVGGGRRNFRAYLKPDYRALASGVEHHNHPVLLGLLDGLGPVSTEMRFAVEARTVYAGFAGGSQEAVRQYIARELKSAASNGGLIYTEDAKDSAKADLCIDFRVDEERSSQVRNLTFVYLNFDLDIKDCKTGILKMGFSQNGVKGGGRDLVLARHKAAERYIEQVIGDFAGHLLKIDLSY